MGGGWVDGWVNGWVGGDMGEPIKLFYFWEEY